MTHDDVPAYGLWTLVIINSAVFILFAFSFFKLPIPTQSPRHSDLMAPRIPT